MSHRIEKVGDMLRAEISQIIQREMRDPRVALASVSNVVVSRDLAHAKVDVSVLGDDEEARQQAVDTLQRAAGFVRSQLARTVRLRTVPELHFQLDRGAEHSQRISDILESLHDDSDGPRIPPDQDP